VTDGLRRSGTESIVIAFLAEIRAVHDGVVGRHKPHWSTVLMADRVRSWLSRLRHVTRREPYDVGDVVSVLDLSAGVPKWEIRGFNFAPTASSDCFRTDPKFVLQLLTAQFNGAYMYIHVYLLCPSQLNPKFIQENVKFFYTNLSLWFTGMPRSPFVKLWEHVHRKILGTLTDLTHMALMRHTSTWAVALVFNVFLE